MQREEDWSQLAVMAEKQEIEGTSTVTETSTQSEQSPSVVLKLRKPKSNKTVKWNAETVDNEFMGKKSSKCCCVYEKPRIFGESSSESDSDDGESHNAYCPGHKKKHRHIKNLEQK